MIKLASTLACAILLTTAATTPVLAAERATDPLDSPRWSDMEKGILSGAPYVFDARVRVEAPTTAENPLNVPITIDATALADVKEILVFADFNPILEILRFYPESTSAYLGFRAKLQQSSPVRAAAKTADGV